MPDDFAQFQAAVAAAAVTLRAAMAPLQPRVALVLGTGLGNVADEITGGGALDYAALPGHPVSTVEGHRGRYVWGHWSDTPVLALQGRFHLYEGYTARDISFPIRVLRAAKLQTLVLTNAAGGLNPAFAAGDLMLLTDHLNLTGHNPLTGPNADAWGPRFPAMAEPYSRVLQGVLHDTAAAAGIPLRRGVYVAVAGPSLETAAETRFLRAAGADAVGMSTVIEAITAVHAGLRVAALSAITNVNDPDHYAAASLAEILDAAGRAAGPLTRLLRQAMPRLHAASRP